MDKPFALIIEEGREIAALFRHILELAGFRTEISAQAQTAVERLSNSQPAIVLLDLDLSGDFGNQILILIRKDERLQHSKVIVVTSSSQIIESLSVEPDLVLFKPISIEQFSDFIERFQLRIKYQTTIPLVGEPWDRVTGLYNQSFFANRLEGTLEQAKEINGYFFSVITVNIDQNDSIKNRLDIRDWISALREAAETIKTTVRPTDTVARFDQDNYSVLVENVSDKAILSMIASRIYKKLKERLTGLSNKVQFPIRICILLCDRGYENVDEILQDAKTARAQGNSQNPFFFEPFDRTSAQG
jgi:diguanylate cyclase (GGDEF)-like protein